jgi:secreted trypsin-like serine protease
MMNLRLVEVLLLLITNALYVTARYECNKQSVPCGCGLQNVQMNARMINGENAVPYSWSMIVSLRHDCYGDGNITAHCCGGTILSESYILTAAHCVETISSWMLESGSVTIAAGIHNRSQNCQTIRKVDKIIVHQNYTRLLHTLRNDIAILHLAEPLDFAIDLSIARTCRPPRLNSSVDVMNYPASDTTLAVIGWGFLKDTDYSSPHVLQQATVYSVHHNHSTCNESIDDIELQFCAGVYGVDKGNSLPYLSKCI